MKQVLESSSDSTSARPVAFTQFFPFSLQSPPLRVPTFEIVTGDAVFAHISALSAHNIISTKRTQQAGAAEQGTASVMKDSAAPSPASLPKQPDQSPIVTASASLIAAVVVCGALHPLDLIKTRMQVASASKGAIPLHYSSQASARQIVAVEGVRGLYKGVSATMIASGISWGVFRYLYDCTRTSLAAAKTDPCASNGSEVLQREPGALPAEPPHRASLVAPPLWANMTAGLVGGAISTLFVHPLWLVKTRLEMQAVETKAARWFQYRGWWHCLTSIYRMEGFSGLYHGLVPALGLVPHAALQIFLYEHFKYRDQLRSERCAHSARETGSSGHIANMVPPTLRPFIWGAASKFVAIVLTYPLQVLRSRQQMLTWEHANSLRATKALIHSQGLLRTFYSGLSAHIQRACLYNGLMFLFFEKLVCLYQAKTRQC